MSQLGVSSPESDICSSSLLQSGPPHPNTQGSEEDVPERSKTCSLNLGTLQGARPEVVYFRSHVAECGRQSSRLQRRILLLKMTASRDSGETPNRGRGLPRCFLPRMPRFFHFTFITYSILRCYEFRLSSTPTTATATTTQTTMNLDLGS